MDQSLNDAAVSNPVMDFLVLGGPAIWVITALSILMLSVILWKVWHLGAIGVWSRSEAEDTARAWSAGRADALSQISDRPSALSHVARTAIEARMAGLGETEAREETSRVARAMLAQTRSGVRVLELIATIAPLIGLLGTVLGMIEAFQALETSGSRADPSALAGGIWEALLTTAAGMAVAIPASAAITWFDSIADRLRLAMDDVATRILTRPGPTAPQLKEAIRA